LSVQVFISSQLMGFGNRYYKINIWILIHFHKFNGNKDSHFWAIQMKVKQKFLCFGAFIIKDGTQVRFWQDRWLGNSILREQYPCLSNMARHEQDNAANVFSTSPLDISTTTEMIFYPPHLFWPALDPELMKASVPSSTARGWWGALVSVRATNRN
jgi:hypothetical protein